VYSVSQFTPRELTKEELKAEKKRIEAQKQREVEAEKRRKEEEKRKKAASVRARELLMANLNENQRKQFEKNGWFVVEGGKSKKSYKVLGDRWAGNVHELCKDKEKIVASLCAHTQTDIPIEDNLLTQKLMLETSEEDFLRIANVHWRNAA
jgi:hypothetical protein